MTKRKTAIQFGKYLAGGSVYFWSGYAIIAGLKAVGITPYIGFFISAGFFTIWSYLWYKYWVFPEQSSS